MIGSIARSFRRFGRRKDGMAATEFAMITPLLLTLYFGITELADGLIARTKVTRVASTAADLVAQDNAITNSEVADIFMALDAIMFPYSATETQVVISSLVDAGGGNVKVAWSEAHNAGPRATNSFVAIPEGLLAPNGSIIMAEVTHTYVSPAGEVIYGSISMSDTFYMRPRRVMQVARVP